MSRKRYLRPYQREASEAFDRALTQHDSTLIVLPTGTGKTICMADIVRRWTDAGHNVLVVAHRIELLDQAADKFTPELGYRPEVIQANRPVDYLALTRRGIAVIASVQTLRNPKRLERFRSNPFDLVLIDEAHHSAAVSYGNLLKRLHDFNPNLKVGGVTATPRRTDKKALGVVFGSVAYQLDIGPAVDGGWLVPPCERKVVIDGVAFEDIRLVTNDAGEKDFDPKELDARMREEKALYGVVKPLLENAGERRWIVFAAGVGHSRKLAELLNRELPGSAEHIDSEMYDANDPKRAEILDRFRAGKIQFLSNYGITVEGFDAPECAGVCIARPTKSLTVLIQMVGRGLRPIDGLVDGIHESDARVKAIADSRKPNAQVLYFIPKAANVQVLTVVDALGGNYDYESVALAKEMTTDEPDQSVTATLEKAKAAAALFADEKQRQRDEEAERRRQAILKQYMRPRVDYRVHEVGMHSEESIHDVDDSPINRGANAPGGCSWKQVDFLVKLGVSRDKAMSYGKAQAGAVIDKLTSVRCTDAMRRTLVKYGENPDVPMDTAKQIIDEISRNGWKPRRKDGAA